MPEYCQGLGGTADGEGGLQPQQGLSLLPSSTRVSDVSIDRCEPVMEHCTIGATCYGLAQVSASFFETPERATRNAEPADGGGWVIWIEAHVGSHALDGLLQLTRPHEGRSHLPVCVIRVINQYISKRTFLDMTR